MSIIDHQPTPPHLVEVVSADSADDVVADVAAELSLLEEELNELDAKATALERRVAHRRAATPADEIARPLVRQVFEAQAGATRTAVAAALDEAVKWAEARVCQARAAAEALVDAQGSGWEVFPEAPPLDLSPTDNPLEGDDPEQPSPVAVAYRTEDRAATPSDAVTTRMPVTTGDSSGIELADDESTAFGAFWVDGTTVTPEPATRTGMLDVVLPVVALLIIVVVMLSWIG